MSLNAQSASINDAVVAARKVAPAPTVESMRDGYVALMAATATTDRSCTVEEVAVAGFPSLLLSPPACDGGLLVWFHGGGFILSSPHAALSETDRLAAAARARCVSVGYRLAPEYPLPAAQLDAIEATRWCVEHADELGVDRARVAVGGDSAGGNLAAVSAQRVDGLAAQLLVYPTVDQRPERRAAFEHTDGYILDGATIDFFRSNSMGSVDPSDPLVSPLLADRAVLAATPTAMVITAELDPLVDDGRDYVAALRAAGVDVEHAHFPDEMHLFFSIPEHLDGAKRAIALAGDFLARALAPS
jgi:acetyl esterase